MTPVVDLVPDPERDDVAVAALNSYRDEGHVSFALPPAGAVAARARQRGRQRVVLSAAAVIVATGLAAALFLAGRGHPTEPADLGRSRITSPVDSTAPPSEEPSATPSPPGPSPTTSGPSRGAPPAPSINLVQVDWRNARIRLPETRDDADCPIGPVTVRNGVWSAGSGHGTGSISGSYTGGAPTLGDLDGDGRTDAVLYVSCLAGGGDSGDSSGQLLVVADRGGELVGLGYVGPLAQVYESVQVKDGRLVVTVVQRYSDVRQQRVYQWDGTRFVQRAGPTAFPSPSG